MKFFFKSMSYIVLILFIVTALFLFNLFTKPFSIDHYFFDFSFSIQNWQFTKIFAESSDFSLSIWTFFTFTFPKRNKKGSKINRFNR